MGKNNKPKRVNINNADPMSNPNTMEREAINIIISIAKGSYDIGYVLNMFRNQAFLQAAIRAASNKYIKADIHRQAMIYTFSNSTDKNVLEVFNNDLKKATAWKIVLNTLIAIQQTGDATIIYNLNSSLGNYKQNI